MSHLLNDVSKRQIRIGISSLRRHPLSSSQVLPPVPNPCPKQSSKCLPLPSSWVRAESNSYYYACATSTCIANHLHNIPQSSISFRYSHICRGMLCWYVHPLVPLVRVHSSLFNPHKPKLIWHHVSYVQLKVNVIRSAANAAKVALSKEEQRCEDRGSDGGYVRSAG